MLIENADKTLIKSYKSLINLDNNLEDWKDEYKLQSTIVYKLGEFKRLLKKLDEKGVLKCNVKLSNAIKKTTLPENTHVVGLANLIPSEGNFNLSAHISLI